MPRSPPRGSRPPSAPAATILASRSTGSAANSSSSGGLSATPPRLFCARFSALASRKPSTRYSPAQWRSASRTRRRTAAWPVLSTPRARGPPPPRTYTSPSSPATDCSRPPGPPATSAVRQNSAWHGGEGRGVIARAGAGVGWCKADQRRACGSASRRPRGAGPRRRARAAARQPHLEEHLEPCVVQRRHQGLELGGRRQRVAARRQRHLWGEEAQGPPQLAAAGGPRHAGGLVAVGVEGRRRGRERGEEDVVQHHGRRAAGQDVWQPVDDAQVGAAVLGRHQALGVGACARGGWGGGGGGGGGRIKSCSWPFASRGTPPRRSRASGPAGRPQRAPAPASTRPFISPLPPVVKAPTSTSSSTVSSSERRGPSAGRPPQSNASVRWDRLPSSTGPGRRPCGGSSGAASYAAWGSVTGMARGQ
jgi:hypothetical protein